MFQYSGSDEEDLPEYVVEKILDKRFHNVRRMIVATILFSIQNKTKQNIK
jgi:hypothetical protein